jgi:hypothetical protein
LQHRQAAALESVRLCGTCTELWRARIAREAWSFDVNDFDETLPTPWEWAIHRLVAGAAIVVQQNGFGHDECGHVEDDPIVDGCCTTLRLYVPDWATVQSSRSQAVVSLLRRTPRSRRCCFNEQSRSVQTAQQ